MSDSQEALERIQREIDRQWEASNRLNRTADSSSQKPAEKPDPSKPVAVSVSPKQKPLWGSSKWLILFPLTIAVILFYARRANPQVQNNTMWAAIGFSAGVVTTKVLASIKKL